jgi:hypothetical protein
MSASKVRPCRSPRALRYHYALYANTLLRKQYADASSRNVRFKSVNSFEVLDAVDSTDGDAKNSSAGSADTLDHDEISVRTPVKEQTRAFSHSAGHYQVSVCVVTDDDDGDKDDS